MVKQPFFMVKHIFFMVNHPFFMVQHLCWLNHGIHGIASQAPLWHPH
jgi:hypothetical protein